MTIGTLCLDDWFDECYEEFSLEINQEDTDPYDLYKDEEEFTNAYS